MPILIISVDMEHLHSVQMCEHGGLSISSWKSDPRSYWPWYQQLERQECTLCVNVSAQSLESIKRNVMVSSIGDFGTTYWRSHQSGLDTRKVKMVCRLAAGRTARSTPSTGDSTVPGNQPF